MAEILQFTNVNPLEAGDLIDRAVRLYRKNFWTLVKIAIPPVLVSTFGSMLFTIGLREAAVTERDLDAAAYVSMLLTGGLFWLLGTLLTLMVMGGASRNLVRHLLWGEAISFRETYRNMLSRFFGLLVASMIIGFILNVSAFILFYVLIILIAIVYFLSLVLGPISSFLASLVGTLLSIACGLLTFWLFFLIASRFAYVPQIMLVEGQSVFAAFGRSTSLASGNVKRLMALAVFTGFATLSAVMILLVPLVWYAALNGIELYSFEPDSTPVWYLIGWQVVWQLSWILLTPIWMIGLSLLYVDERVRHEGYDIELMAARQLGEMPALPKQFLNPLHPALAQEAIRTGAPPTRPSSFTSLDLH
ncbi:MAG TPA: hypothetical protein VGO50_09020 [Pyrinomonadaceae bacterium]|jgi:hypothetical protein|nr:hypothetical protein [Pyrinomonadaceae bacterium]